MTVTQEVTTGPGRLVELGMSFCAAKMLLGAVELGLFTLLADGPATEDDITERLGLHGRGLHDLLTGLHKLALLEREEHRYRNSADAAQYLVRGKPEYLGPFLERTDRVLYPAWEHFTDALRTGEAQLEQTRADGNMFVNLYRDPAAMRNFLAMMDALNSQLGHALSDVIDWADYKSVLDVGGARGNLMAHLIRRHQHLSATVFDLPAVEPAFDERMTELGVTGQIRFVGGDFFADSLPAAEVVIVGHVLEDWSQELRDLLLKRVYQAVRPGGIVIVYDPMLDDELSTLTNLATSLTMLVVTRGGAEYTADDCQSWLRSAGFTATSSHSFGASDIAVVGHKER